MRIVTSSTIDLGLARAAKAGVVFRGPALPEGLLALEQIGGAPLPDDFVAFYARHDGAEGVGIAAYEDLLAVDEIAKSWRLLREVWSEIEHSPGGGMPGGIAPALWSPAWLPFTHDGGGSHLCIDVASDRGPKGRRGRVIRYWNGDPDRQVVAPSFAAWLSAVQWTP